MTRNLDKKLVDAKEMAAKVAKLDRTAQVYILGEITARLLCKQNGNKTAQGRQGKEAAAVSRYTIKRTGPNWYSLINRLTGRTELQTTRAGMEAYAEIFGVKMPKEVSEK